MSFDLHVFGTGAIDRVDVEAAVHSLEGCRLVSDGDQSDAFAVERMVRGGFDYCFSVDGPFRVDREDLPRAVSDGALGVGWTFQISVEGSNAACTKLAGRFSRGLAEGSEGVVYDPQQDAIVWPRGGTRKFTPERVSKIDVVTLEWFVRREDTHAGSSSAIVFDTVARFLPEALPRRFGSFEPLQGRLDESGRNGFIAAWRNEPSAIFWKGTRPCLGGSMFGLGDDLLSAEHAGAHPVGTVSIDLDGRAFLEGGWNEDAVALFVALSERLDAFYAHAEVDRDVDYSGGNIWYRADSITNPGLVVRNVWMGLPSFDVWLAWFGGRYRGLVEGHLPADLTEARDAGLLLRTAAAPGRGREGDRRKRRWPFGRGKSQAHRGWRIPGELVVKVTGEPPGGWLRERAEFVPDGL